MIHNQPPQPGPGWLREFASTLPVHSQFVFHGNVHDRFISLDGQQLTTLPQLLWEVLRSRGFGSIISYDQVDGIGVLPTYGPDAQAATLAAGQLVNGVGRRPKLPELRTDIEAVVNAGQRSAFLLGHASRLTLRSGNLESPERDFFLFCTKLAARALHRGGTAPYNPLIWLVESELDLPPWFTVGNAHVRSIAVPPPDLGDRHRAAALLTSDFPGRPGPLSKHSGIPERIPERTVEEFAVESHGLTLEAMAGVAQLARERGTEFERLPDAVATYRLGVVENPWQQPRLRQQIADRQQLLSRRVTGQPQAVAKALDVLKRAALGMSGGHTGKSTNRPRGVLFFAGPTGVGKTELAKSIAQLVFGDEGALLRFDMSEFSEAHAADRLIGAPPGYVGYDAGGQLTNAVRGQPFRVILFDEIEKAHQQVMDKFLQILEDGRLTDGRGDTTYFSESILIFTSNLGVQEVDEETGTRRNLVEPGKPYEEVERAVRSAIGYHFRIKMRRPELLNRIGDNIVVFNYIEPGPAETIFAGQLANVHALLEREHGISLTLERWVTDRLRDACLSELSFGGRGIGNEVEAKLVNPLARALFDQQVPPGARVSVTAIDTTAMPPTLELMVHG